MERLALCVLFQIATTPVDSAPVFYPGKPSWKNLLAPLTRLLQVQTYPIPWQLPLGKLSLAALDQESELIGSADAGVKCPPPAFPVMSSSRPIGAEWNYPD